MVRRVDSRAKLSSCSFLPLLRFLPIRSHCSENGFASAVHFECFSFLPQGPSPCSLLSPSTHSPPPADSIPCALSDPTQQIMVLLKELNLSQVTLDYSVKAFPTHTTTAHSHLAPLGKIPALEINNSPSSPSTVLFGSQTIAQYLDSIVGGKAIPSIEKGIERFECLTTESLADGICEAALALRYERLERVESLDRHSNH